MDLPQKKSLINIVKAYPSHTDKINPLLSNKGMPKKKIIKISTNTTSNLHGLQTERDENSKFLKSSSKTLEAARKSIIKDEIFTNSNNSHANSMRKESLSLKSYLSFKTYLDTLKKSTLPNQNASNTIVNYCHSICINSNSECESKPTVNKENNENDENILSCIDGKTYRQGLLALASESIYISNRDLHIDCSEVHDEFARDFHKYDKCMSLI